MRHGILVGLIMLSFAATPLLATEEAADKFAKSSPPAARTGSAQQRAIAEFDTDGDGKLNATERRTARMELAKRKRSAQNDGTDGLASSSSTGAGNGSSSMNPYATGSGYYPTNSYPMGMNPYSTGTMGASYYYYSSSVFSQLSPQSMTGSGMSGGCMQMGSSGGRR